MKSHLNPLKNFLLLFLGAFFLISSQGCEQKGCTNPDSSNYDPEATVDDGSCILPETGTFNFNLAFKTAGQDMVLGDTVVNTAGGRIIFDQVKMYISRLELVADDNSSYPLELVDLFDAEEGSSTYSLSSEVPPGNYRGVRFGIGLDDSLNALDPSTFASAHPMSSFTGMYWSWSSKYIFMKLDGYGDDDQTGSPSIFIFHTGLDSLYREVEMFANPFSLALNGSTSMNLSVDFEDVFYNPADTIKFWDVNDNFTHTTGNFSLAERVANNFAAAIKQD